MNNFYLLITKIHTQLLQANNCEYWLHRHRILPGWLSRLLLTYTDSTHNEQSIDIMCAYIAHIHLLNPSGFIYCAYHHLFIRDKNFLEKKILDYCAAEK